MKATFIEKQDSTVKFEIEYAAEEFENALIDAYKATKDQFVIDGFRKGKAPRKLIMQRYGQQVFDDEAVEKLLQRDYPIALTALDVEPISRPSVDVPSLTHGEGFTVKFAVETPPEFEIKDYEGVKVESKNYPVTDEDVESQLEKARERGARHVNVERAAEEGDTVNIDYAGSVDGVAFTGGTAEKQDLKLGSGTFIPGFEEQLVGKKPGDDAEVLVTFPEEYHAEELAGKQAVFICKVNEVRAEEKPELNDEFAQDISEFDTIDALRADIRAKLEDSNKMRAEIEMKDAILQKIYEANDIEAPEIMVEDQQTEMLREFEQQMVQQGFDLKQYFQISGKSPDELRESVKGDAIRRVKTKLIIQNIARMQGIGANDEETDEELGKMAEQYGMDKDNLKESLGEFQIGLLKEDIKSRKVIDYIYASAITESE